VTLDAQSSASPQFVAAPDEMFVIFSKYKQIGLPFPLAVKAGGKTLMGKFVRSKSMSSLHVKFHSGVVGVASLVAAVVCGMLAGC
jgi:hypothetical protein